MNQTFNDASKAHINRDDEGIARDVLHVEEPCVSTARTPQLAAQEYLEKFSETLRITAEEQRHLGLPLETRHIEAPVEYRYLQENKQFDMTTVAFSQTRLGLPVREAGLAVQMR